MKTDTSNEKVYSEEATMRAITIGEYKYIVPSAVASYIMKVSHDNEELNARMNEDIEKNIMGTFADSLDQMASLILDDSIDREPYEMRNFEAYEGLDGKKMTKDDEKLDIKNRIAEALNYPNADSFVKAIGQYQRFTYRYNPNDGDVIAREHSNRIE